MDEVPIVPGLVRDNTIVLYAQMTGLEHYRMSMVSKAWNVYCMSKRREIKSRKQLLRAIGDGDILSIVKRGNNWYKDYIEDLIYAHGDEELIEVAFKKGMLPYHTVQKWNWKLRCACKSNAMDTIQSIVDRGGALRWDWGLIGACEGGNNEVAQLMIDKGTKNYNWGLWAAGCGGQLGTAMLMAEKWNVNWDEGLYGACYGGSMAMAQFAITKGADNFNAGLYYACEGDQMEMVQFMITKGADDWNQGLYGACENDNFEIQQFMIMKGATSCSYCEQSMEEHLKRKN